MTVYETIWNFIMTYILPNPLSEGCDFASLQGIFYFVSGTDGAIYWTPLSYDYMSGSFSITGVLAHILTILACFSLCFILWKLITLPIRWAVQKAN